MGKRIVIAGAGGFGQGVYSWILQSEKHRQKFDVVDIVFIDDNPAFYQLTPGKIISTIQDYHPEAHDELIVAVGVPAIRRKLVEILNSKGCTFHQFVDDRVAVGEGVQIGVGVVICPGTVVSANASIGDHVHVNFNCSIGHDTEIGDFSTLSPSVNVMGQTKVGSDVFVGGSAAILPRIEIVSGVTIGSGAVVVKSLIRPDVVVGNPARPISIK